MSFRPADLPTPPRLYGLGRTALFLDLDGTIAAIRSRPEEVGPERWRTAMLGRLQQRLEGRLAVISGRTLAEIDRILEGAVTAVAAVHGLVRRCADGQVRRADPHPAMAGVRERAAELVRAHPGLLLEDKGLSLAIHYRLAPSLAGLVRAQAAAFAEAGGLKLQPGDMVAEICTPGPDKGVALEAFMVEPPFAGSQPVFVGDDLTDEDGFAAARSLGGFGVLVGPVRPTQADRRLGGAEQVRSWLEEEAAMQDAQP
jgi:trehalose 6-phosphate phosphatase